MYVYMYVIFEYSSSFEIFQSALKTILSVSFKMFEYFWRNWCLWGYLRMSIQYREKKFRLHSKKYNFERMRDPSVTHILDLCIEKFTVATHQVYRVLENFYSQIVFKETHWMKRTDNLSSATLYFVIIIIICFFFCF